MAGHQACSNDLNSTWPNNHNHHNQKKQKQMETQYQLNAKNLLQNTTSLWAEWILVISIGSIIRFEWSQRVPINTFLVLVEVSILNAFIIHWYCPSTHQNLTNYLDFRVQLAKELIGGYNGRKQLGRPPSQLHTWPWSCCRWNNAEVSWLHCSTTV